MNWNLRTPTGQLQKRIWEHLRKHGPRTAEELSRDLGESYRFVQPRVSELYNDLRLVVPTEAARGGVITQAATVWKALEQPYPKPACQEELFQ